MKSDDFKKKFIENTIIKYGVENISKLEFVKNKKKETFQKKLEFRSDTLLILIN